MKNTNKLRAIQVVSTVLVVFLLVAIYAAMPLKSLFVIRPNTERVPATETVSNLPQEYQPNIKAIERSVSNMGGYIITDENEYFESIKAQPEPFEYATSPRQSIRQKIIVKDNLTRESIQNAVVWLNGVARWTDRDGTVDVIVDSGIVELKVEKNDYSPYIEYIDVGGMDIEIYLRHPSDDIEIFAAFIDMDYKPFNLFTQDFYVNLDTFADFDTVDLQFYANVEVDEYRFYANDTVRYSTSDSDFIYNVSFDYSMLNADFYVQAVYDGIESRMYQLHLYVVEFSNFAEENLTVQEDSDGVTAPLEDGDSGGIFAGINIDLSKVVSSIYRKFKPKKEDKPEKRIQHKLNLKAKFDALTGDLKLEVGYSFAFYSKKNSTDVEKKALELAEKLSEENKKLKPLTDDRDQKQVELNDIQRQLKEEQDKDDANKTSIERLKGDRDEKRKEIRRVANQMEAKQAELKSERNELTTQIRTLRTTNTQNAKKVEDLTNKKNNGELSLAAFDKSISQIDGAIREIQNLPSQNERGLTIDVDIIGVTTFNIYSMKFVSIDLSVDASLGYKFKGVFVAGFIPMFYTVSIKVGFKAELELNSKDGWIEFDNFWEELFCNLYLSVEGELGAGVNGFLSASLFAKATLTVSGYWLAPEYRGNLVQYSGIEFEWKVGVRLKVFLILDFEFGAGDNYSRPPFTPQSTDSLNTDSNSKRYKKINGSSDIASNMIADQVYSGSRAKVENIDGNSVATWVRVDEQGTSTELVYSVLQGELWSEPQRVTDDVVGSDFYHDMYFDGKDLHVTWQRVKDGNAMRNLERMSLDSEIYYAKFDKVKKEFLPATNITNDSVLNAAPKFALKEKSSDPLTIVWQENSQNDILGVEGTNSIHNSTLAGSTWKRDSNPIYREEQYLSFVTSAYKGGNLTTAFLQFDSKDLATATRQLMVVNAAQQYALPVPAKDTNNPQFGLVDGKARLWVHGDQNVLYSDDLAEMQELDGVPQGQINDTYKVLDTNDRMIIHYNKLDQNQVVQVYASILDKHTNEWQLDVALSSEKFKTAYSDIAILDNGNIMSLYNVIEVVERELPNGDTVQDEIVTLNYNTKEMQSNFEITTVFYDRLAKDGDDITLTVGILNVGDSILKDFEVTVFGTTHQITLQEPLQPSQQYFIELDTVLLSQESNTTVTITSNGTQKTYNLQTYFTIVAIEGFVEFDGKNQTYVLTLSNTSSVATNVTLSSFINGVHHSDQTIFVDAQSEVVQRYKLQDLQNGDFLLFELDTEIDNLFDSNNFVGFEISGLTQLEIQKDNQLKDILNDAKQWAA